MLPIMMIYFLKEAMIFLLNKSSAWNQKIWGGNVKLRLLIRCVSLGSLSNLYKSVFLLIQLGQQLLAVRAAV